MNAVEIYEKAVYDLEHNKITCGEYDKIVDPLRDVQPVKHGHWIQLMDYDSDSNALFECSVCRGSDMHAMGVGVPYCWHCGARMEGDK